MTARALEKNCVSVSDSEIFGKYLRCKRVHLVPQTIIIPGAEHAEAPAETGNSCETNVLPSITHDIPDITHGIEPEVGAISTGPSSPLDELT